MTDAAAFAIFPFLFGGTFIEGVEGARRYAAATAFPFLFGGTFIETGSSLLAWETLQPSLQFCGDFP